MDIDYKENFLKEVGAINFEKNIKNENKFIDKFGVFKGEQTSTQHWLDKTQSPVSELCDKILSIDELDSNNIDGIQILEAHKPYDVHSDFIVTNNQKPLVDPTKYIPTYTVLIPIVTGNFHTVIFNQTGDYNNFSDYKNNNQKCKDHVPNDVWNRYLSHCHSEDQEYLSIKKIFNWKAGDMMIFHRKLFHSSANFQQPKKAIVAWLSKYN